MDETTVLDRIRCLCSKRNWSLYRLSKESGIPTNTLYNMMNRTTTPTVVTIFRICDGLGMSPAEFFTDENDRWPDLTADQKELLDRYNLMDDRKRELLMTYLRGLSES